MNSRSILWALVLGLPIAFAAPVWSDEQAKTDIRDDGRTQVQKDVDAQTDTAVKDKRTQLIKEAATAIDETHKAIAALEKDDINAAIDSLALATGKLETIVARDPDLALAPVEVNYLTYDVLADIQKIKDIGNRIQDYVDDGELQAARALLRNFASEIVIQTTSLPLATYPDAILEATRLLDEGKKDEAINMLNTALSTQVVTEDVIPLPPLRAEAMIEKAKGILDGTSQAKAADEVTQNAENAEVKMTPSDYVEAARQELKLAEVLGYGQESDFEDLHKALDDLDDKISSSQDTSGIFSSITNKFATLRDRLFDASN
jgi:hypothetical protein